MKKLLIEIGVEELPARFIEPAVKQLEELLQTKLSSERINCQNFTRFSTPRRLAVICEVAEKQLDLAEEVKGPPKNIAFKDGEPTKAALGFARSQGVDQSDLFFKEIDGAEYVMTKKHAVGQLTQDVLAQLLPNLISSLTFPKNMRWANSELRYARPIRWIVALLEQKVIPFSLEGVKTSNITYGHRQLSKGPIVINHPQDYLAKLEEGYVIANQQRRKALIEEQLTKLADKHNRKVMLDEKLLSEVVNLVEYPTAFWGQFEAEYLQLPKEVLITSMKEHQRYFSVFDMDNQLAPEFIGVRNGADNQLPLVISGNEKVLRARLADAKFFYEEDRKQPLESNLEALKSVVFQDGLGSIYDKVGRIVKLASDLVELLDQTAHQEQVVRTAKLAKADLVSQMVYEFPELQGIMGAKYAELNGEAEEVVIGIIDHYKPKFATDDLPRNIAGTIVSLADKLDTLVGYFGLGKIPTGSQDPFALRRQALGVVQILLGENITTPTDLLIEKAINGYDLNWERSQDEIKNSLLDFFKGRLRVILLEKGYRYDCIDAVLALGLTNLPGIEKRIVALEKFRKSSDFIDLYTAYERCANLAQKSGADELQIDYLTSADERLYEETKNINKRLNILLEADEYEKALLELANLRKPVDIFFEQVMIMDKDDTIRENRLALLKQVIHIFDHYANFSIIVIDN